MKTLTQFLRSPICLCILLAALALPQTACQTRGLDPTGVYQGDAFVYQAENTIAQTYVALNNFLTFVYQNQATLPKAILKGANELQATARPSLQTAANTIQVYKTAPTAEGKDKVQASLEAARSILTSINTYLQESQAAKTP
jgi:phosphoglycerol transferase MdoB-like AlkP superfamily enzyme